MTTQTLAATSAAIILSALQKARDDATTPEAIKEFDRAIIVATESGVLVTRTGEPVVSILDELFRAMPSPNSKKATDPWERALPNTYRPRYRIAGLDKPGAPIVMTDTVTGRQRVWQPGEQADNVRGIYQNTDSGAGETAWGVGICGIHTMLTIELMEKAED